RRGATAATTCARPARRAALLRGGRRAATARGEAGASPAECNGAAGPRATGSGIAPRAPTRARPEVVRAASAPPIIARLAERSQITAREGMAFLSRVVWSEGMHLAQHHFQAQGRYFEDLTTFALSGLYFKPYGLLACELDAEALVNGTVAVTHARGVMPDGLPFQFPEDPPPAPLAIADLFSPTQDSHRVLLAISPHRPDRANCALEPGAAGGTARFLTRTAPVPDEVTGADVKPVTVAHKNFRLLLEGPDAGDMVTLPLARVRRDGSGHFVYDPDYVPPCLQVGASRALVELLARLVEKLDARADALRAERGAYGAAADYASREIASFWLSHAIHSSIAPLRHHLTARAAHPEEVFQELSRLAGALCTFSLTSHPRDLPSYDHDDATSCFLALERHIREHLDIIFPTNSLTVPLA